MKTLTIISFIIVVANIVFAVPCSASNVTNDGVTIVGDNVSGTIYTDVNANGIQDVNEPGVPHAIVNIHQKDTDMVESIIVDEFGNFDTGIMTFDSYIVWGEDETHALSINNSLPVVVTDGAAFTPVADLSSDASGIELGSVANLSNDTDSAEVSFKTEFADDMEMNQLNSVLLPFITG